MPPSYSKATKRGIIVFTLLMVLIFVLPDVYIYFKRDDQVSFQQWSNEEQKAVVKVQQEYKRYTFDKTPRKYLKPPSTFDPNKYTEKDWINLGMSEKQAHAMRKFLKYPIYSNAELKRIFVLPEQLYELIKDSTLYPSKPLREDFYSEQKFQQKLQIISINTATLEEVLEIRGIGVYDAKNIVKYRDALGGFYSENQYAEVWKSTPEKMEIWKKYLRIEASHIQKININTCSSDVLAKHPYISWNLANSLVKLRLQNGNFSKVDEVKKSVLMTEALYEKISPYLKIEE